jgi:hypothetical protein
VRATDAAGNTDESPASHTWSVDATPPVASASARNLITGSTLGTNTIPIRLSWSATDSGSGVASYQLQQSVNGGTFADVSLADASATSTEVSLNPDVGYAFRVSAQDKAGNQSQWAVGSSFIGRTIQQDSSTIGYVGK